MDKSSLTPAKEAQAALRSVRSMFLPEGITFPAPNTGPTTCFIYITFMDVAMARQGAWPGHLGAPECFSNSVTGSSWNPFFYELFHIAAV